MLGAKKKRQDDEFQDAEGSTPHHDGGPGDNAGVDPRFLELVKAALEDDIMVQCKAVADATLESYHAKSLVAQARAISEYDKTQDARHKQNEAAIIAIKAKNTALEDEQKKLRKDMVEFQRKLDMVESPDYATSQKIREAVRARSANESDPTILRTNTQNPVAHQAMEKMLLELVEYAKVDKEHFHPLQGDPMGSHFTLRSNQAVLVAAADINKVIGGCRDTAGKWRTIQCESPDGMVQAFVSKDEADSTRKPKILSKRVFKKFTEKFGEADLVYSKRSSTIFYKSSYIAKAVWQDGQPRIRFHEGNITKCGLNKDELEKLVVEATDVSDAVASSSGWSLSSV